MLQAAMRLVYQLLLTLFSYSLGPVTPSMTYFCRAPDHVMRCAQKRATDSSTSSPQSAKYAVSPV